MEIKLIDKFAPHKIIMSYADQTGQLPQVGDWISTGQKNKYYQVDQRIFEANRNVVALMCSTFVKPNPLVV